jgi:hypothetical protein
MRRELNKTYQGCLHECHNFFQEENSLAEYKDMKAYG